jgi:hypothetical protein
MEEDLLKDEVQNPSSIVMRIIIMRNTIFFEQTLFERKDRQ